MTAFITHPAELVGNRGGPAPQFVPATTEVEHLKMPTDLQLWFGVPTILAWIEQEICESARTVDPAGAPDNGRDMLRVLSYAYATQVFSSEDIARHCHADHVFQRLCRGRAPFVDEVRSFRRKNRLVLEKLLSGVFMRAILQRFGLVASSIPAELHADLSEHARARLNIARHLDAGEE